MEIAPSTPGSQRDASGPAPRASGWLKTPLRTPRQRKPPDKMAFRTHGDQSETAGTMTRTGRPTRSELKALARRDPKLGRAIRRLPPFPDFANRRSADSHFHSLARTIIYQQLAGNAAATIHDRVRSLTAGPRFPRPEEIMTMPPRSLREAGLSGAKQLALTDLADKVLAGELSLRSISRLEDGEVIRQLTTVRGIGPWSAQMFLIFRLGRLDVLPSGDLGVQEGLRILDGLEERPSASDLEERGACWAPLRSLATWTLYRVVDEARGS